MKKLIAAVAIAGIAGLTACTPASDAPAPSTTAPSATTPSKSASAGAGAPGVKESCELFNSLFVEIRAAQGSSAKVYDDIYFRAQDAKDAASGNLKGLFAALSMVALDKANAAPAGGAVSQESQDALRDAVFANAGACTAEDVTLKL